MIIALVQIPMEISDTEALKNRYIESTKIFRDVQGLRQKYYLESAQGGGGVYEFDTRENAEAWFNDGWADWMEGRFGVRPTLTIFNNPVVLDNKAREVRANGEVIETF